MANVRENVRFNSEDYGSLLIYALLVMNGSINNVAVRILRDDGCDTNIVFICFFAKNRKFFEVERKKMRTQHSTQRSNEEISIVIKTGK